MTDRWSSDEFNRGQSAILRRMAEGAPLGEVMDALARLIEELLPGVLCSVLQLSDDGRHFVHSAAPLLPADYSRAIDGSEIGPWAGSCGTAAFLGSTVIATDVATVLLARNGREAIEMYDAHADEIVAILMDLTMPVLAGALDELLRREPAPQVILTSGFSEEETAERFAGKPLAGFLQKPYHAADIRAVLARCVEEG